MHLKTSVYRPSSIPLNERDQGDWGPCIGDPLGNLVKCFAFRAIGAESSKRKETKCSAHKKCEAAPKIGEKATKC